MLCLQFQLYCNAKPWWPCPLSSWIMTRVWWSGRCGGGSGLLCALTLTGQKVSKQLHLVTLNLIDSSHLMRSLSAVCSPSFIPSSNALRSCFFLFFSCPASNMRLAVPSAAHFISAALHSSAHTLKKITTPWRDCISLFFWQLRLTRTPPPSKLKRSSSRSSSRSCRTCMQEKSWNVKVPGRKVDYIGKRLQIRWKPTGSISLIFTCLIKRNISVKQPAVLHTFDKTIGCYFESLIDQRECFLMHQIHLANPSGEAPTQTMWQRGDSNPVTWLDKLLSSQNC